MTVRELIRALRKFPPDTVVAMADHDHQAGEISGFLRRVEEAEDQAHLDRGIGVILRG